jgi:hypothetical protein
MGLSFRSKPIHNSLWRSICGNGRDSVSGISEKWMWGLLDSFSQSMANQRKWKDCLGQRNATGLNQWTNKINTFRITKNFSFSKSKMNLWKSISAISLLQKYLIVDVSNEYDIERHSFYHYQIFPFWSFWGINQTINSRCSAFFISCIIFSEVAVSFIISCAVNILSYFSTCPKTMKIFIVNE